MKKFIKKLEEPELANKSEIFFLKELVDFQLAKNEDEK